MKRFKYLLLIMLLAIIGKSYSAEWSVDKSHTSVIFSVSHMVISSVSGYFKIFDGKVSGSKDDFSDAKIEFSADINSINTDNTDRDNHLKSNDFFNAAQYPKLVFKSESFKKVKGNKYVLIGNMTIRGVTKKVKLDVIYNGTIKDPYGKTRAGFKITGNLNRFDFGLSWSKALETGGLVVGKDVAITCNVEIIKD
jgi:polyisoprenoid-binding protein YceI